MKKNYICEFTGTFFLVFVGTGAIIVNSISADSLGNMGISFAFGFIIVVMIYALGDISGAHFNPAVTIAFYAVGEFDKKQVIPYIVSQLFGAISASVLLRVGFGNTAALGSTLPALHKGSSVVATSFILEFVFTFLLMSVIIRVAKASEAVRIFKGLAIGFTVFIGAVVVGPISGGSFNPARSIAPAFISGTFKYLWLYITAPILGSVSAAFIYKTIKSNKPFTIFNWKINHLNYKNDIL